MSKVRERAGIPNLLVHDLRRTAARNMIRAGVPEKQVVLIAGWKTRSLLDRYDIIDERDLQAAAKVHTFGHTVGESGRQSNNRKIQ